MKILVLGAGGMAGHVISLYLRESGHEVDTLSAKNYLDNNTLLVDVTDKDRLREVLKDEYEAIINCIALLVRESEEKKDLAVYLNSYLPHYLESYFKDSSTKVIHISTDDVFSDSKEAHKENSLYDGQSFYGRSKALGEIINDKDLTFRMSIIGPSMQKDGTGLFNWFWQQTGKISGYSNVFWNGITTLELAKAINAAINQNLSGVFHLVPKENISKFDLLCMFKEVFERKDIEVEPIESNPSDKTLKVTREDFDYKIPVYKAMIEEMRTWINSHPKIYPHYDK